MELAAQRAKRDRQRRVPRPWQRQQQRRTVEQGMQAFLRAEAVSPSGYGDHASRLRVLLDQLSNNLCDAPWREACQTLARWRSNWPDDAVLDEAIRELVATQTLMPYPDELYAAGQILAIRSTTQVRATIETLMLPLLRVFIFSQHAAGRPHGPALEAAALATLGHLGQNAWAKTPVRLLLREYCESDRVTHATLNVWLYAHHALATHEDLAQGVGEDLLLLLTHSTSHEVKETLQKVMDGDLDIKKLPPARTRKLVSHVVPLDSSVRWDSTPLADAVSDDGVLNLDMVDEANFAACDDATKAALLRQLNAAQRRVFGKQLSENVIKIGHDPAAVGQ